MANYLILLNKDEDTVSFINTQSKKTEKKIKVDHNPHEAVISPQKDLTYITCSLGNRLNIIDNNKKEVLSSIQHPSFQFPHGLAITPDGKFLILAVTYASLIMIWDTEKKEFIKSIPTHQHLSHMVSLHPEKNIAYIPNIGSNNITVLDTEKFSIKNHFPVGRGPEGVAIHPATGEIYVANQEDNNLLVIDPKDFQVLHKRPLGTCPIRLIFTPDGQYALIPNRESNNLSIIDTAFPRQDKRVPWEVKRLPVGVWPGGTAVTADGRKAYVANNKTNDISIIDLMNLEEEGRIKAGIHPDGIALLEKPI